MGPDSEDSCPPLFCRTKPEEEPVATQPYPLIDHDVAPGLSRNLGFSDWNSPQFCGIFQFQKGVF